MSKNRTRWGTLTLVENPPVPDGVEDSVEGPVSDKVPRTIHLHGNVSFVAVSNGQRPNQTAQAVMYDINSEFTYHIYISIASTEDSTTCIYTGNATTTSVLVVQ